ncbi:MAG: hypothetical protein Q4P32_03965, partial [Micrococcales bacterium]|nr:hypothetical protein [Micrococcales bacterium]
MTTSATDTFTSSRQNLRGRAPVPPANPADWRGWIDFGLAWSNVTYPDTARTAPSQVATRTTFPLRLHSYQEDTPGRRWKALYDATWVAYSSWYKSQGFSDRPSLAECRQQMLQHMPELVPVWDQLVKLSGNDTVTARLLSMWRMPSFACGCSQAVVAGSDPLLV